MHSCVIMTVSKMTSWSHLARCVFRPQLNSLFQFNEFMIFEKKAWKKVVTSAQQQEIKSSVQNDGEMTQSFKNKTFSS